MKNISQLIIGVIGIIEIIYYCFYNQTEKTVFGYEVNSFLFILFWATVTIFAFYFFFKKNKKRN
ncbi:hypothetical protein JL193_03780 [Polaribacter batillariae]|uniref:Uncharacterized protein n=1 Tax=Polaribacter batillariae TaxID=2808900 RepID=A0ABX7SX13_9FLAO|nr:hypothetical protein [Polaribacter batillariae]QTD38427.1 hypothetical protein JL193_03780 [Polaribacter batillariae]